MKKRAGTRSMRSPWTWVLVAALWALGPPTGRAAHFPWDQGHNHRAFPGDPPEPPVDTGTCPIAGGGCNCNATSAECAVQTGNEHLEHRDLLVPGPGISIDVTRAYNSRDSYNGPFGWGWHFTYGDRAIAVTDGPEAHVIIRTGDGQRLRFKHLPNGAFEPPVGGRFDLVFISDSRPWGEPVLRLRELPGVSRYFAASDGRLLALVDRSGANVVRLAYDAAGFISRITDAAGRAFEVAKTANGKIASITDPIGRRVRYAYDGEGHLTSVTDPAGGITAYEYDAGHNLVRVSDPTGVVVHEITYDGSGRVATETIKGERFTLTYATGKTTKRDGFGSSWQYFYNQNGNIVRVIDPLNKIEEFTYDERFNLTSAKDKNDNVTSFEYDDAGRRTVLRDPLGRVTRFTYEPAFRLLASVTDPAVAVTRFEYDAAGNLIRTTDAAGKVTSTAYDERGNILSETNALGETTRFVYDTAGNQVATTDPTGHTTRSVYDAIGNRVSVADPAGNVTRFEYDVLNRVVKVIDSLGQETSYSYDPAGRRTVVLSPNGGTTQLEYDQYGRPLKITNPIGKVRSFVHDLRGRLTSTTTPRAQTISYRYDAVDRVVQKLRPEGAATYTYDAAGNLLTARDTVSSLAFAYDAANQLVGATTLATSTQPATTFSYVYDVNGNRVTMTDPEGLVTAYRYDALNRLTAIDRAAKGLVTIGYDAVGRQTSRLLPNGSSTAWTFDAAGEVTAIEHRAGGTSLASFQYTYDLAGNRTSMTEAAGTNSYTYDALNRLTSALHPQAANPAETFAYDAAGNWLSSHRSTAYAYDTANELLTDDAFTYAYDANGNVVQKTDKATSARTLYAYDSEDRLVRVTLPGGTVVTYAYDTLGRRIQRTKGTDVTRYVYDGDDVLLELDGLNAVVARYTRELALDEPLTLEREGTTVSYHADAQGSIRALTDESGAIVSHYTYSAYGELRSESGTIANPFTYTGRERDRDTGLLHYRARTYEPGLGRFLQVDPLVSKPVGFPVPTVMALESHEYAYASGNPVLFTDPFGLQTGGTGDCGYYDGRCSDPCSDAYACKAAKCCRDFGESKEKNCVRTCLIDDDRSRCAMLPPAERSRCRIDAHWRCYRKCGFRPWRFWNVPRSCVGLFVDTIF